MSIRNRLLSTTFIPVVVGVGVGLGVAGCEMQSYSPCNPCQAATACSPCNPCAAKNPCNPCAAASACNPCEASNPCATNNPCNPCAAAACNPCAVECVVPRLAAACNPCNPCAAKNPCNPCNPCAAACNPCNPCAAKNPCNPCNPCAAACNPCNPCAAKNPCNPCNPCAAACNPCNPCAAAAAVELTDAEAKTAYDCIKGSLAAGYGASGLASDSGQPIASAYQGWQRYSTRAYVSDTHGGRYVQNYANATARSYGKYENLRKLPTGSVLAKDSFVVRGGRVVAGPFFVMEKMPQGFNADSGNWRYTLVMPDGKLVGTTNGKGSANVEFCYGCHMAAEDTDSAMFLPEEYRVKF